MTKDEYEAALLRVAEIQRQNDWSEASIESYAKEHRLITGSNYECILAVGAGLAQDNTRHGVGARTAVRCDMGVGCDETGQCYAAAMGEPDKCPLR
jgi:hypothetical protein